MSEKLVTCPVCLIPNFTARGLKAHKCKGGTRLNPETGLVEVVEAPQNNLMTAFHKTTLDEMVESIAEGSGLMAMNAIRNIVGNSNGFAPAQVRTVLVDALTRETRSKTRRQSVVNALKTALKKFPESKFPGPAQTGLVEVVDVPQAKKAAKSSKAPEGYEEYAPNQFRPIPPSKPKDILQAARASIDRYREVIYKHEVSFSALTLGPRLQIGLAALKAYQVFVMPDPKKTGAMKGKKKAVTRDGLLKEGFEGWLESEVPWLKKPTAYKYMTAVRGLGLDHTAAEKQVAAALKLRLRKGPVTLKSLCDAAVEAIGPPAEPEQTLQQSEFDFLCEGLRDFRIHAESIHALKGQLQQNPELLKVATARAYSILFDLTGTHWSPSDAADGIALIDPDSITL